MQKTEIVLKGSREKPIPVDIRYKKTNQLKPIVIFCHGFKGFKDWGHFNLIADEFAKHDFVFVKFNFSYNGTTPENPVDFSDLDAFGNNNFSIELDDLGLVIDYIESAAGQYEGNGQKIYLIGHSRGGGIAILKTYEDARIHKLATWASVKDVADFFINQDLDKWKADGLIYTLNARTQQKMPLYNQVYEDFIKNKDHLDIPKAAASIDIPWLIVHGTNDESVPLHFAEILHQLNKSSEFSTIEDANHSFGGQHLWNSVQLPRDSKILTEKTIAFLKQ
ncbi:MAG: alpha/beta hydrolase [Chitinophagales bacterium]|nr:alpha/beta hydrolase [Chitinophagales bacterium]